MELAHGRREAPESFFVPFVKPSCFFVIKLSPPHAAPCRKPCPGRRRETLNSVLAERSRTEVRAAIAGFPDDTPQDGATAVRAI